MNNYYLPELKKKTITKMLFLIVVIVLHFYNFFVLFPKDISLKCFLMIAYIRVIFFYSNDSQILGFQNNLGSWKRIMN